jgi:hypothetical protein
MAMYVFDCVYVWGAGHVCGVGRPYGQKVGDEGSCGPASRRTPKTNNSGTPNAQQRGEEKYSHIMRFVDLNFLHLPW